MAVVNLGKKLPPLGPLPLSGDDWQQANPRWIETALARTQERPTGGWYTIGSVRSFGNKPRRLMIASRELVAFRTPTGLIVGPNACPHMGARLDPGRVEGSAIVCPWHGLRLGCKARGSWKPLPVHEDGVLAWVRLPEAGQAPTEAPILNRRPANPVDGVIDVEMVCDPEDVIANRLDPWHGAHFHPYGFASLVVTEIDDEAVTVRVAKRLLGPACIEVEARFHSPQPRCITMTITAGEGEGSVVEAHATPIKHGLTMLHEASLAHSGRKAFRFARRLAPLVRPFLERSSSRLWVDDKLYAERRYALRNERVSPLEVARRDDRPTSQRARTRE